MNTKKSPLIFFALILFIFTTIPQKTILADAGPKASMEFTFIQNGSQPEITIISGILYVCDQSDCKDAYIPKTIYGIERELSCTDYSCYAIPSGEFYQLEIKFSDGNIRKSNVFAKYFYASKYEVTINKDKLFVRELNGSNLPIFIFSTIFLCPVIVIAVLVISLGITIYTLTKKEKKNKLVIRLKNEIVWIAVIFFIIAGVILNSRTFTVTLITEAFLIVIYQKFKKLPYKEILKSVLLANIITQPIFVFIVTVFQISNMGHILLFELGIWLIESVILYKLSTQLSLKKTLGIAFFLNAISFGIGLLLPI